MITRIRTLALASLMGVGSLARAPAHVKRSPMPPAGPAAAPAPAVTNTRMPATEPSKKVVKKHAAKKKPAAKRTKKVAKPA